MTPFQLESSGAVARALSDTLLIYIDFDQAGRNATPPAVAAAARHVLGLATPVDAWRGTWRPDELHDRCGAYLAGFDADDPTGRNSSLFVSYVSAFFHEARHVYDLISTGFGLRLLLEHLNTAQNVYSLAALLRDWQDEDPARAVRLPITAIDDPAFPYRAELDKLIQGFENAGRRIAEEGAPPEGIYRWMSRLHLLEANATLTQLDIINDLFGARGVTLFETMMSDVAVRRKYLALINDVVDIAERRDPDHQMPPQTTAFLLWVALQGNARTSLSAADRLPEGDASEVAYFLALQEFTSRSPADTLTLDDVQARADEFNRLWGFGSLSDRREVNLATALDFQHRIERRWAASGNAPRRLSREFVPIIDHLRNASKRLNDLIDTRREDFFSGYRFALNCLIGTWPGIRIHYRSGGQVIQATIGAVPPLLPVAIWDRLIVASALMHLLIAGRGTYPAPHLEESAFDICRHDFGLKIEDDLFRS